METKDKADFYIKRFEELYIRAQKTGAFTYTGFHSQSTLDLVWKIAKQGDIGIFGGYDNSERAMIRFGNTDDIGYEEDYLISIICIEPKQKKFSEALTHRDFLGAILNTGIERKMVGDILVRENVAYVFVCAEISGYITSSLDKVKHTSVSCSEVDVLPDEIKPVLTEEEYTVTSVRLDSVLAKVYNLSRSIAKELVLSEKVSISGRICKNPEHEPRDNDVISVRGHGKFVFVGTAGINKKGKYRVQLGVYR